MSIIKKFATGAIITAIGLGFWASKAFYTVDHVIDGDTFVTTENQHIRFDSVNAPEIDMCLGKESKEALSKLILNRKVYLKVTYIDGMRLIASVYTAQGNVGEIMLKEGMATFADKGTQYGTTLRATANKARASKLGVYSSACTQTVNPVNPSCDIKGNTTGDKHLYRYPGCQSYTQTVVELHMGDKWFCSETEAKKLGFTKGSDCQN